MAAKLFGMVLISVFLLSGIAAAATAPGASAASSEVAAVKSICPDSATLVDCSNMDRSTTEWIGADGCKYKCKNQPASTCSNSPIKVDCSNTDRSVKKWTGSDGCEYECAAVAVCPVKSPILEDCNAIDMVFKNSWYDSNNCLHKCKEQTSPNSNTCRNPPVPAHCFDGSGATAYLYKDANGCFQYGCKLGKCVWSKPTIDDCSSADADRPDAEFWWDNDGCYHVCSSSELAKWIYTPIGTLCLDKPELSFTGYFPNSAFYSEFYNRDSPIHQAVAVQRIEKRCSDNSEVKRYELWLKAHDVNGKIQTYCNYACRNRYYEQCILDGTFDSYVDEWCLDKNGNKIVPLTSGGLSSTGAAPSSSTGAVSSAVQAQSGFTLSLSEGWNMVSVPVRHEVAVSELASQCGTPSYAWSYILPSGYSQVAQMWPAYGYWLKAPKDCTATLSGGYPGQIGYSLSAGWNLIGAPDRIVKADEYLSSCSLLSGPWQYSPSSKNYVQATALEPGKSYWVKVSAGCTVSWEGDRPPAPPS